MFACLLVCLIAQEERRKGAISDARRGQSPKPLSCHRLESSQISRKEVLFGVNPPL